MFGRNHLWTKELLPEAPEGQGLAETSSFTFKSCSAQSTQALRRTRFMRTCRRLAVRLPGPLQRAPAYWDVYAIVVVVYLGAFPVTPIESPSTVLLAPPPAVRCCMEAWDISSQVFLVLVKRRGQ